MYFDKQAQLEELSDHYEGELILVSADDPDVQNGTILFGTDIANGIGTIRELGVSEEDLLKDYFTLNRGEDTYICTSLKLESGNILICCESEKGAKLTFFGDVLTQIMFAAVLFAGLIVWCYSILALAGGLELNEDLIKKYDPKTVRITTGKMLAAYALFAFVVAHVTLVMQHTYQENIAGNAILNLLEEITGAFSCFQT